MLLLSSIELMHKNVWIFFGNKMKWIIARLLLLFIVCIAGIIENFLDQSPSGPSEKWPRTSKWDANWSIMCANDGCSKSSAAGNGGSHRGLWCLPRKLLCKRITTSQNTNLSIKVLRKSSPKNCTYDESKR